MTDLPLHEIDEEDRTQSKMSKMASIQMLDVTDRIFEQTPESMPVTGMVDEDV